MVCEEHASGEWFVLAKLKSSNGNGCEFLLTCVVTVTERQLISFEPGKDPKYIFSKPLGSGVILEMKSFRGHDDRILGEDKSPRLCFSMFYTKSNGGELT